MNDITHVVLLKGEEANWGYASEQIGIELEHCGVDTYFVDYRNLVQTIGRLDRFAVKGHTALITFNFRGISREIHFQNQHALYIWDKYEMRYFNILMDHPMFFDDQLKHAPERMLLFCADRNHVKYVKKYYPKIKVFFLPVAGNVDAAINMDFLTNYEVDQTSYGVKYRDYEAIWQYANSLKPIAERKMDVVFTANYVPIQNLFGRIKSVNREHVDFLMEVVDDLGTKSKHTIDEVMIRHLEERHGKMSPEEITSRLSELSIMNLCIRTIYREKIIRKLANSDIKVHVYGADWNLLSCKKPWNIKRNGGNVPANVCVNAVQDAKIALNILPLFTDGAHERVFTAMLQKSVALTDRSNYLDEKLKKDREIVFYDYRDMNQLPEIIMNLLSNPDKMQKIADAGFQKAFKDHTWRERTHALYRLF